MKKYVPIFLLCFNLFAQIELLNFSPLNIQDDNANITFSEKNVSTENVRFGYSVSNAGDVNGDGYDDIIVGATGYSSNKGMVYIFFGGNNMDLIPDLIMVGQNAQDYFGYSVSTAGDVNNDGFDDVIVGAKSYKTSYGRVYLYFGDTNMDTTADWIITGGRDNIYLGSYVSSAGDVNNDGYSDFIVGADGAYAHYVQVYFGGSTVDYIPDVTIGIGDYYFPSSVSGAGDVNGDGYDDIIVGNKAWGIDINNQNIGRAYIFYGGSTMNNGIDVTLQGEASSSYFGSSVSDAGDVNGDGFSDVIVGAETYGGYPYYYGRAYIFYGGESMNSVADVKMLGETTYNYTYFGKSVSGTGDLNDDGFSDVVVGASGYNSNTGKAYIYFGSADMDSLADLTINGEAGGNYLGFSVSNAKDVNDDGIEDLIVGAYGYQPGFGKAYIYYGGTGVDNIEDKTLIAEGASNYFGYSVANAGDVNKDGYDDIIVGAYNFNSSQGRVYLYYGGNPMDNIADVIMTGQAAGDFFGFSVSSAGDVNGDGYDDIVIGAYKNSSTKGRVYIYYGGENMDNIADVSMDQGYNYYIGYSVSSAGDVNGDGYEDVIAGAVMSGGGVGNAFIYYGGNPMDAAVDVSITGPTSAYYIGCSVSSAGDVNGDGFDDVVIGSYKYPSQSLNRGSAYIYLGGSSMDNIADVTMTGEANGNYFGISVSNAGDVNNDGFDDVIIGAHNYNSGQGRAYIFYGSESMDNVSDVIMTGESSGNNFGYSVSNAGDINGNGFDDVVVGAVNYNSGQGRFYAYYGGSNMNNTPDIIITGPNSTNNFSLSVSTTGDVNGDGISDIVVGEPYNDESQPDGGKAYLYYGVPAIKLKINVFLEGAYR